jgi:hypothetical protein
VPRERGVTIRRPVGQNIVPFGAQNWERRFASELQCRQDLSGRLCLKCDGTRAKNRFRLSAKRASLFKSAGGVSSVDY